VACGFSDHLYHESCRDRSRADLFLDWGILIGSERRRAAQVVRWDLTTCDCVRAHLAKNKRSDQIDRGSVVACVRNIVHCTQINFFRFSKRMLLTKSTSSYGSDVTSACSLDSHLQP
jgi:hypothetical protein